MVETRKTLLLREFFLIIFTKQKANKFSGFPADKNLLAFLVPWRQTKTHGQYFIGNLELKNHPNPHNLKWKTVSQFLIGKV